MDAPDVVVIQYSSTTYRVAGRPRLFDHVPLEDGVYAVRGRTPREMGGVAEFVAQERLPWTDAQETSY